MAADFVDTLVAHGENEDTTTPSAVLHLFGGPFVTFGCRRVEVPEGSKRLLVFVALHCGRVERRYAAGTLRSALWRLNGAGIPLLEADKHGLAMRGDVAIDLHAVNAWAARLIAGSPTGVDLRVMPWGVDALDLLSGWYDDWALIERERVRQRLLHALEALSRQLIGARRCAEAVEVAMMAVGAEPLRESAQRILIEAHLAEGNRVEARRSFDTYRDLLDRELGAEPDLDLTDLIRGLSRGWQRNGAAPAARRYDHIGALAP
jgi:DNA-binding SARP family transcriptional activator